VVLRSVLSRSATVTAQYSTLQYSSSGQLSHFSRLQSLAVTLQCVHLVCSTNTTTTTTLQASKQASRQASKHTHSTHCAPAHLLYLVTLTDTFPSPLSSPSLARTSIPSPVQSSTSLLSSLPPYYSVTLSQTTHFTPLLYLHRLLSTRSICRIPRVCLLLLSFPFPIITALIPFSHRCSATNTQPTLNANPRLSFAPRLQPSRSFALVSTCGVRQQQQQQQRYSCYSATFSTFSTLSLSERPPLQHLTPSHSITSKPPPCNIKVD